MRKSAIDIWVGIFVAIGLLAALFLALMVGNMNAVAFAPTYKITARFDNIGLWWMFIDEATRLDSADSDTGEIEQRAFTTALLLRAHLIRMGQMPRVIAPVHATDHAMECMVMEAARMADLRADPDFGACAFIWPAKRHYDDMD